MKEKAIREEWTKYATDLVHFRPQVTFVQAQPIIADWWLSLRQKELQELEKTRHDWLREEIVKLEGMKKRTNGETQECSRCGLPRKASEKLMFGCSNEKGTPYRSHLFRKSKNITKDQALQTIIDRYRSELEQPTI